MAGLTALAVMVAGCGSGKDGPGRQPQSPGSQAGRIVFADAGDLIAVSADGARRSRLTHTSELESQPAWSPDGRRVAFVRGDGGVYVMNADGGAIRRVTQPRPGTEAPSWSPDGRRLAFGADAGEGVGIYIVGVDGSGLRRILRVKTGWVGEPGWSPDGRHLAVALDRTETGGETDVYSLGIDGAGLRRVTRMRGDEGSPEWSRDGTRILFGAGGRGIYTVRPDGSDLRRVANDPIGADGLSPTWSPDGRQIAFTGKLEGGGAGRLYVVNADGSRLRAITGERRGEAPPHGCRPRCVGLRSRGWGVQGGRALLERDEDLRRIDALVEAAIDGRGAVLTVAGEAGIGKTTLLRAAAAAARGRDLRVIEARGGSLEREFAYGVVRQLLEGLLAGTDRAERAQLLSGAAAPAAALLDPAAGQLEADPGAGAAFAVAHALYWLVAEAAEREPLLLVVDDAHWGDAASLRWIVFLARRLAGMRAGLVLAWRTGRTGEHDDLLGTLSVEPLVEAVEPAPLSDRAVGALLEAALGAPAAGAFVAACHELTGGNPFLLRELVIAVRERGVRGTDEDVTAIRAMTPRTVSRSVLLRLAPLGDDARELARATAVLDSDAAPWLAARVAGLDERRATVAGDALQRADILEGMRFRHPLLRRAVYDELTPPQRSRTHRRAAEALCAAGEPEHGAVHLLATDPAGDPWVVEQLHAAALRALSRGAPAAAIPLLDRALREPPAGSLRPRLLLARGRAAAATLSRDAETLLRQALEEASDAETQAAAAHDLSRVLLLERRVASAVSVLDETRRRLAAQDPARAAAVEVEAGLAVAYGPAGAFADAERRLRQAAERAVLPVPLQIAASFGREWAEICADGRLPRRRARRLRATIEAQLDPALEALGPSHVVFTYAGMVLGTYGDLEAALEVVRTVIDTARGRGDVLAELMAIALRGRLFWYLGRLGEAESDGRIAFDAGTELAYPVLRGFAGATLAYAQAHRNELDEADAVLALFDLDGARDDATTIDVTLYGARAELRWAQGRPADALDDVETYFAVYARGDGVPPFMSVRALRTRALIALGRMDEARNWAREEVDRFRAEESAPEALGMSLAALGLAEGGAAGLALLDEAVAVLRHSQRRLELGRALIDQGAALRRARRRAEAREPLREGMEIAAVSGAPALVETARQELEATGARPRRVFRTGVDALTPSERRIASMAATGMTNSQIAQALFVTPKTVETHLRHVFQKLDVSSRGELGERLAA